MPPKTWDDLSYWNSPEYKIVQERLDNLTKSGVRYNPDKKLLFRALEEVPLSHIKCVIIGQDPYPNSFHATGLAFSVPSPVKPSEFPASLRNIFDEYEADLHYPRPTSGDLLSWSASGVLLWNAVPSCEAGKPASHHWPEWELLTREIVETLDRHYCIVFVLLGRFARSFSRYITASDVIETSHPSPLGVNHGFKGSRIFSTVNARLAELDISPINWRLPDVTAGRARS